MNQVPAPKVSALAEGAASAAGSVLAGASRAITWSRGSRKPLHPEGDVVTGRLVRTGGDEPAGVPWLDSPGDDEVLVRFSRAIGLPRALPDIHGIAVRIPVEDRFADLLLASTGLGRFTRFVLTAGFDVGRRPLTTLLPYRGPYGPVLVAARAAADPVDLSDPVDPALSFDLLWSRGLGEWVPFARLTVSDAAGPDPAISFDPVRNPLPGLEFYGWVQRLREPAYHAARDASGRATGR
ncbi:hypothetical protein SFC88_16410 [Nocardioides sp. HM23]|uniref:hypothetical protein n=1 Tax=Nocardioides bizhenqiangii TaxID=3095076 RepID=UPI002ACA62F9|nr:hypothetical protein [Nocardioides sp. HM23]MDZ5622428.1 hypothetical protein [Nocardioides sp. HM23]